MSAPPVKPPLHGLVEVAGALRSGSDLADTLITVARTLSVAAGFRTVVINLHRPAWDDYEVVAVHGDDAAREALTGTRMSAEDWEPLMRPRFLRRGAYFIPGEEAHEDDPANSFVPDFEPADGPDAWTPEDSLFVPLRGSTGAVLGILSVDEPSAGRRPSDGQLDTLVAVAAQAALAVESAQNAAAARRHHRAVEHLLGASSRLAGCRTAEEVLEIICAGIREALGFSTVVVALADRRGPDGPALRVRAAHGWAPDAPLPTFPLSGFDRVLAPEHLIEGCSLLEAEVARALVPDAMGNVYRSHTNGRGALGWNHHWLVVPLHSGDDLIGIIWVDDPEDRLLPTVERLQALRAFANMAANALESVRRLVRLQHLADHDPLTGLRNRRGLLEHIDTLLMRDEVSVVVLDVDHFKRVNDRLGYEAGDCVLTTVARVLEEERREEDVAARLGGEEFALVLRGTDQRGALAVAERVRQRIRERVTEVPWGLTVSAGGAGAGSSGGDAAELTRAANRALIAAKRMGRDRCVVHAPETVDALLSSLDKSATEDRDQTAAVILLAEAVDLRDAATAQHSLNVGRYAEAIANALGLDPIRVERLRTAGLLHDLGKLAIADAILHKPGPLTPDERLEVQRHCELGARILEHAGMPDVASWVLAHHERLDGRGYPRGLHAGAIPMEARVLAVADAYEAMTARRPYRNALRPDEVRRELTEGAGTQFDPAVVRALLGTL